MGAKARMSQCTCAFTDRLSGPLRCRHEFYEQSAKVEKVLQQPNQQLPRIRIMQVLK